MSTTLKIAVIGGDGTGPEVTAEALKVLKAVAPLEDFKYETTHFDWGGERYLKTGETLPDGGVDELRKFDAIFLGAVGHPDVAPGILEKGLLLELRFQLDQYINLRPVQAVSRRRNAAARTKGPKDIDFVVVRENTEDLYCGVGGFLKKNTPDEVATQDGRLHPQGLRALHPLGVRVHAQAEQPQGKDAHAGRQDQRADLRPRSVVAHVPGSGQGISRHEGRLQPRRRLLHVDGQEPEYYDVIVTTNMFGDIITDLGAIIQGGMGVAAGGNINPDPGGVSMFEPMGGSAPKYTGQNVINPIAAINAMSMLLEHTGQPKAAARDESHQASHRHEDEEPGRRQDGLHHEQVGDLVCEAMVKG